MTGRDALRRFGPAVLLVVLAAVFFHDSLLGPGIVATRDTLCDYLPWRLHAAASLADGEIPLWNPHSRFGQPFVASPQSAVFYPPHLLFNALSPGAALRILLLGHVAAAGIGMAVLCRRHDLDAAPAVLGGVAYAFGTYLVAQQEFLSILEIAAWCPWTLLVARRLDSARSCAVLALVLAVQYLAGHPQTFAQNLVAVAVYVALLGGDRRALARRTAWAAGAVVLGMAMAAFQVLPTSELLPLSVRGVPLSTGMAEASLHPSWLLTLLDPLRGGDPAVTPTWSDPSVFESWLATAFVGWIPLLLALLSLQVVWGAPSAQRRLALCGAVLAAVGFLLALGDNTPVYPFLHRHVPLLDRFRWPAKFLQLFAMGVPMLAAVGLQCVLEGPLRRLGDRPRAAAAWGLVLLSFAQLHVVGRRIHAVVPQDVLTHDPAWLGTVRAEPWGRVHTVYSKAQVHLYGAREPGVLRWAREASVGDALLPEGIDRTWGGDVLKVQDAFRMAERLEDPALSAAARSRLTALMGVRWVVFGPPFDPARRQEADPTTVRLVRLDDPLPRAYLVGAEVAADGPRAAMDLLLSPSFDPRAACVVEAPARPGAPGTAGNVTALDARANSVEVSVLADRAATLVLLDTWFPGWTATVDGRAAEILRVNRVFRGVRVPPGAHTVRMVYRPAPWYRGLWIAAGAFLLCVAVLLRPAARLAPQPKR